MAEIPRENEAAEAYGITDLCIVHGWYRDLAKSVEEAHGLNVDIPNMSTEWY
jgi:hypothetical protein